MAARDLDRFPRGPLIAALGAVVVLVLGVMGYLQLGRDVPDAIYGSAQLFVLSCEEQSPPWTLQIARFGGLVVSGYAVLAVVLMVVSRRFSLFREGLRKGHVVIVGIGPEAVPLAHSWSRREGGPHVAVIGDFSDEDVADLSTAGTAVWRGLGDLHFGRVVAGADETVIVGTDDDDTIRLLGRVRALAPEVRPRVVFESGELTRQWLRGPDAASRPLCRVTQVALATLLACPPYPARQSVPDPLIIGGGALASELLRRIVTGWQRDGMLPRVRCLTNDASWVEDVVGELGDAVVDASLVHGVGPHVAAALAREVREGWVPPPANKATLGGLRVYVVLGADAEGVIVARAVLDAEPDAQVALVVRDGDAWREILQGYGDRLALISREQTLADPDIVVRGEVALLREELLLDAASWPPESPALFGRLERRPGESLSLAGERNEALTAGVARLTDSDAALLRAVLAAGRLSLSRAGRAAVPPLVGPDELAVMAALLREQLVDLLPADARPRDVEFWSLELASRMPGMAQRAGWQVEAADPPMLSPTEIERMAELVHATYTMTQAQLGNATDSDLADADWAGMSPFDKASNRAVVYDYPVKLAAFGLSWRRATVPVPYSFSDEQIELLAIAEHRRWSHHQRRNGRAGHHLIVPWEDLSDGARALDENNAVRMAFILGAVGVEVYSPARA